LLVSGDCVSLCSPSREKRFSGVHCFFAGSPKLHTIALPLRLPSFLPFFSSLLFSSRTHIHVGSVTFLTSSSFPVTPTPSFARHRVRFRLLFLSCFAFPAFCLSLGPHALSVVSFVSEVLKVCACFVSPHPPPLLL
jgi:hypothetical protein